MAETDQPMKKRQRFQTRQWTAEEIFNIISYMRDLKIRGTAPQHPTSAVYYEKVINHLQIQSCNHSQMRSKINNMKKKYSLAIQWANQTGQGVETGSILDNQRKMCPFFDILHEIYGERKTFRLLYMYCSAENVVENGSQNVGEKTIVTENDIADENNIVDKNVILGNRLTFAENAMVERRESDANTHWLEQDVNSADNSAEQGANHDDDLAEPKQIQFLEYECTLEQEENMDRDVCEEEDIGHNPTENNGTVLNVDESSPHTRTSRSKSPLRMAINRYRTSLSSVPPSSNGFKNREDKAGSNAAAVIGAALTERANAQIQRNRIEFSFKKQQLQLERDKFEFEKKMRIEQMKFDQELHMENLRKEERLAELRIRLEHERLNV